MLVLLNSYKMRTNEIRMFQERFAIGTGQVSVGIRRQLIKLQNNDSLNDVSADRNIEQTYGNLFETFNAIKTFTKKRSNTTWLHLRLRTSVFGHELPKNKICFRA